MWLLQKAAPQYGSVTTSPRLRPVLIVHEQHQIGSPAVNQCVVINP
jgi:hypothetical protein